MKNFIPTSDQLRVIELEDVVSDYDVDDYTGMGWCMHACPKRTCDDCEIHAKRWELHELNYVQFDIFPLGDNNTNPVIPVFDDDLPF